MAQLPAAAMIFPQKSGRVKLRCVSFGHARDRRRHQDRRADSGNRTGLSRSALRPLRTPALRASPRHRSWFRHIQPGCQVYLRRRYLSGGPSPCENRAHVAETCGKGLDGIAGECKRARTVVLKLKTKKFESLTRSITPPQMPTSADELADLAASLFTRVEASPDQLFRLVRVGLSNFQTMGESPLFGASTEPDAIDECRPPLL